MEKNKLSNILNPTEDEERTIKQGKWQKEGMNSTKYSYMENNSNDNGSNKHEKQTKKLSKRKRINKEQFEQLTALYVQTDTPSHEIREQIGMKLGMTNREVQVWFQNKRAKNNKLLKHRKNIHIPQPIKVLDPNDKDRDYLKYAGLTPPITPSSATATAPIPTLTPDKVPLHYSMPLSSDYDSFLFYPAAELYSSQQGRAGSLTKISEGTTEPTVLKSPVSDSHTPLETSFISNKRDWSKTPAHFIRRNDAHSTLTLPSINEIGINVLAEAASHMPNK